MTTLASEHKAVFVVHRLEIDYKAPARLYDALEVTLRPAERGRARLVVAQSVRREHALLAGACVVPACMNPFSGRPTRIPAPVLLALECSA